MNPHAAPATRTPPLTGSLSDSPPGRNRHPRITLWIIALLAGIGWRAELELRTGWASLDWISQFHWAVPAGVLAFILWVLSVTRVKSPAAFAAALLLYSIAGHVVVESLLKAAFGRWIILSDDAETSLVRQMYTQKLTYFLLLILVPFTFSLLCRLFGVRVRILPVLVSAVLFMLSWLIAAYGFFYLEGHGDADLIHALKSGYIIPILILSLGLPVLRARRDTALPPNTPPT